MKTSRKVLLLAIVVAGAGLVYATELPEVKTLTAAWFGGGQAGKKEERDRAIPVVAAPAVLADVPVHVTGVGTVKPVNSVVVRAQVSGRITEIGFQEGQDIKAGDVIARLDDALYRAQFDQAVAKKAQDEALLENAIVEFARLQRLAGNSAATQQQLEAQQSQVAQYKAQVQSDQAAIEAAQAQLDYTTIRAPIDGRTGIRNVDIGNTVASGDTTGIVTLSQIRPITVIFSVPQQELGRVNAAQAKGPLTVDVFGDDGKTALASGRLTVVDNQVDATTGTVKLRAEFTNEALTLWPGAFVNARLLVETLRNVLTIPSAAVQRGPGGTYCYIVRDDNTVRIQAVDVTMQDDRIAVIGKGVREGEKVVTTGFARLQDGSEVRVSTPEEADPAKMAVPLSEESHGQRRKGGGNRNGNPAKPATGDHATPPGQATPPAEGGGDQNSGHRHQKGEAQPGATPPATPAPQGASGAAP
ncbi:efflux RND transporter periplasmic adaptor subunit [Rhizobium paknamense]|uniref:Multidrug efflux system membrane fusion protein n=1 Tax=Rhizobium paknamense TaxID=1206817 RepID=A0ABU0IIT8_9HYPH|nr:efflux RND transporter periplasmic adaptor subunit [Rhizobium paknamense]MDQ0458178.1 multidrug efflux system membrane fusion protein [Rhizobium paknamense]